jgi:hypothetical protein
MLWKSKQFLSIAIHRLCCLLSSPVVVGKTSLQKPQIRPYNFLVKTTTLILQLLVNRLTFSGKSWYFSQALDYLLWFNITVNYFDEYLTFKIEKVRTTYVQSSSNNKDNIYWKIKEYHPSLPPTSPTYCPVWSGCLSLIRQTQQLGITRRFPAPKWPWIHNIYWRYAAWRWHLL